MCLLTNALIGRHQKAIRLSGENIACGLNDALIILSGRLPVFWLSVGNIHAGVKNIRRGDYKTEYHTDGLFSNRTSMLIQL